MNRHQTITPLLVACALLLAIGAEVRHLCLLPDIVQAQSFVAINSLADITGNATSHPFASVSTPALWVQVVAPAANAAAVRLAGSAVSSTQGAVIAPGGSFLLPMSQRSGLYYDLSTLYYYAASGDKVSIIWGN